jgi:ABC-type transport system involved in cytochrome bd biosynthesis fused ATPase/permease subunit
MESIAYILILAVIANAIILFYYVAEMAETRGRSVGYWVIFSLVLTPVISIVLLACIGETRKQREQRILYEEKLRQQVRNKYAHRKLSDDEDQNREYTEYMPKKTINDIYRK